MPPYAGKASTDCNQQMLRTTVQRCGARARPAMQAALLPRTQLLRQFMPAAAAQQLPLPFHGMQTRDFSQKKKATAKSRKKVGRKNRDDLPKIAAILKKLYMKVGSALVLVGGGGERKNAGRNSRTRARARALTSQVHPDLWAQHPQMCEVNDASFQSLRGFLEDIKASADQFPPAGKQKLPFYMRTAGANGTCCGLCGGLPPPTTPCAPRHDVRRLRARARVPRVPPCAAQVKCVPRADSHPSPPSPQTRKYSPRSCSPCAPTAATAITWCQAIWAR